MDTVTYSNAGVVKAQNASYISVKLNAWEDGSALFSRFGGDGIPATYIVDAEGTTIREMGGYVGPEDYLKQINGVANDFAKLNELRAAAEKSPEGAAGWMKLGDFAREFGARSAAQDAYAKAVALLEGSPRLAEALYRTVQTHAMRGAEGVAGAEKAAARFDAVDPEDKSGFADNVAIERSIMTYYAEDEKAALKVAEEAAHKYPKTDEAGRLWYLIGIFRHNSGDHDGAIQAMEHAAKVDPKSDWGKRAVDQANHMREHNH